LGEEVRRFGVHVDNSPKDEGGRMKGKMLKIVAHVWRELLVVRPGLWVFTCEIAGGVLPEWQKHVVPEGAENAPSTI